MIGSSPLRKEDRRLLAGAGRFVDDLRRDGMVHLAVVRSVHAHARIIRVGLEAARKMPGVLAAWSRRDLPDLPPAIPSAYAAAQKGRPWAEPVLAADVVRYVG